MNVVSTFIHMTPKTNSWTVSKTTWIFWMKSHKKWSITTWNITSQGCWMRKKRKKRLVSSQRLEKLFSIWLSKECCRRKVCWGEGRNYWRRRKKEKHGERMKVMGKKRKRKKRKNLSKKLNKQSINQNNHRTIANHSKNRSPQSNRA